MNLLFADHGDVDEAVWDDLVDRSDEAWFFHQHAFQPTLAAWPNYEQRSFALVGDDGAIKAVIPCFVRSDKTLECFGGPAICAGLGATQRERTLHAAYSELVRLAGKNNCSRIFTRLSQMSPAWRGTRCPRTSPLLPYGYSNELSQTYVIDLTPSLETIWKNLQPHCRTHIRKAEREGCTIRLASASEEDLETYYEMHCVTYQRSALRPHPRRYFELIWNHFVRTGQALVFFAEKEGKVLSADNEIFFKGAVSGWTAAGLREAGAIGANNLLHWHAIRWAREAGAELYESGEAFPGAGEGKEKGLDGFKKSFGGDLYPIYRGHLELGGGQPGFLRRMLRHPLRFLRSAK